MTLKSYTHEINSVDWVELKQLKVNLSYSIISEQTTRARLTVTLCETRARRLLKPNLIHNFTESEV